VENTFYFRAGGEKLSFRDLLFRVGAGERRRGKSIYGKESQGGEGERRGKREKSLDSLVKEIQTALGGLLSILLALS